MRNGSSKRTTRIRRRWPTLKRTCLNLKRTLNNYFREENIQDIITKAFSKLKFKKNEIPDMKLFVADICAQLEPYQLDAVSKDPAIVDEIDLSNTNQVESMFQRVQEQNTGATILRTGWQGLNRMLDGGFRRGEEIVLGALQHNYKTGMSLSCFKHIALYNAPQMIDPTRKPLLVRISFEDSALDNFQFLYQSLMENETGQACITDGVTPEEMTRYVQEKLGVNGYHIKILRVDPSQWTYKDITNLVLQYESEGYEIHVLMLDYLAMVPTTGCIQTTIGSDIRDMFRRMRNFTAPRGITLFTPHQLSSDAKRLIREGRGDFVKEINGKGYYDGCQRLDQEVDVEIYQHIEIVNGKSYLTMQRGKHRKTKQTPIKDRYCVLPFEDIGGIRDDINGPDTSRKKPGGGPIGSVDEVPFWEANE